MTTELKEATNFDDCVSNKISLIADEEPKVKPDQRAAIAYNMCRKKFGISKASILFLLEKSQLLADESLLQVKATMEKGMNSCDWVEFAALMKKQGSKHKEIIERVNKSESWIKKYVNPIFQSVTPTATLLKSSATSNALKPGLPIHTILKFTVTEIKKETRTFGGWGSVEVLDSQEEVVSIDGLEAIMPTYMKRGAPIMYGHSNRHVGNVFKYQIKEKSVKGENIPALWLEGRIFSDYKIDDLAWEAIQYAYTAGLPVLSLGATPLGHPEVQCNDIACFKKYSEFQLYEFTVTEQQIGSVGANPEATVEVALAKSKEGLEVNELQKQAIGEHFSQLSRENALPDNDVDLVNMMLATCKSCQDEYKKMIETGQTEDQAKASLLKDLVNILNKSTDISKVKKICGNCRHWKPAHQRNAAGVFKGYCPVYEKDKLETDTSNSFKPKLGKSEKDKMKMNKTNETADAVENDSGAAIEKSMPLSKEVADLAAAITKIDTRLEKIEQAVTKQTANIGDTNAATADSKKQAEEPKTEEEEEEKKPIEAKKAESTEEAEITFSKDFAKNMDAYLAKKGLVKIAETPVPVISEGRAIEEIQKGTANDPVKQAAMPTDEEMRDAMANWKHGGVTSLGEKYKRR